MWIIILGICGAYLLIKNRSLGLKQFLSAVLLGGLVAIAELLMERMKLDSTVIDFIIFGIFIALTTGVLLFQRYQKKTPTKKNREGRKGSQ